MIRFVDLKTGNTFDGESPYVFWFDNEQSTNIIYSQPICFISNQPNVEIIIEENDIFSLVDTSKLLNSSIESIYGFDYHNINEVKVNSIHSVGVAHHNYFIHMIYIVASSKTPGEYICKFTIAGSEYQIGADFYGENEELYINLSNNGIEIPDIIQKALYNVNIHEESRDNITLNRKWKELLSNYWEVIANKGSYKSLYNSLSWFEYGDLIRLSEIWKDAETGRMFSRDIAQLMSNQYSKTLNGLAKTTYEGLYCSLEKNKIVDGKIVLDKEKNPVLEYVSFKWSTQDLALKLCLLGNFYETYFMPIHLDLIHSTIEDVVYTNTFKIIRGTTLDRSDFIFNCEDIKCNVKDDSIYRLGIVDCYVGPDTLFGLNYSEFKNHKAMIGVQREPVEELKTNEDWATFASQLYSEVGSIVDFELDIPLIAEDKIKREILLYKTYSKGEDGNFVRQTANIIKHKLLDGKIKFSLFCPIEGEYDVRLQLDTLESKTYTKHVRFKVIDTQHIALNVYKIQNAQMLDEYKLGENSSINEYYFSRRKKSNSINLGETLTINPTLTYVPAKTDNLNTSGFKWKGVCLNHLLILNIDINTHGYLFEEEKSRLLQYYFCTIKNVKKVVNGRTQITPYTILVSNIFGYHPSSNKNIKQIYEKLYNGPGLIYRDDYIFVPEFHNLVPIDNDRNGRLENIKYYEVTDNDALCVIPELAYGKDIAEYDWEFVNDSKPFKEPIKMNYVKEPFITTGTREPLEPGYYTIKFHYRLTNEDKINTIELNSAFKKV